VPRGDALVAAVLLAAVAVTLVDPRWSRLGAVGGVALLAVAGLRGRDRGWFGRPPASIVVPTAVVVAALGLAPDGTPPDVPSWSAVASLTVYPVLLWVLLAMAGLRRLPSRMDSVVTGALGGLSVGMAAWIYLSRSLDGATSTARQALVVVPLALDVLALLVSLQIFRNSRRMASWWAMHGGIAAMGAAHGLLLVEAGRSIDLAVAVGVCQAASAVLLAASVVHRSVAVLVEPAIIEPRTFGAGHVAVVVAASLTTPAALVFEAQTGQPLPLAVAVAASGVGMVLAAYLVDLLHERTRSEHRVNHDRLTGLPNRTLFDDRVERALVHAGRSGSRIAVFFIDIDGFKAINDTFGHAGGDLLLRVVAERIRSALRDEDTVARISGDEFAVLLPHVSSGPAAVTVADRIMSAFAEPLTIAERRLVVGASMGVAIGPDDGTNPDTLLANADAAMYRAKDSGRSTVQFYDHRLSTKAHARLEIETSLLRALEQGELVVHYQPIVSLESGAVVSAEALVRWEHPESGLLLPGHFVPVAEQSDLVIELGEQVLHAACHAAVRWQAEALPDVSVSVNVAARQFRHDLSRTVTSALRITGLPASQLILELTESAAVDNIDLVAATLDDLRQLGIRASIDDFGTGYCGLRYLSTLPVDNLKIDKSFIQSMTPANASIVAATIAMAHSLGLTVTAEGVEANEQRAFLRSRRCDQFQGYLLARPMPEAQFRAFALALNASAPHGAIDAGGFALASG